jgi:hypothetical protein
MFNPTTAQIRYTSIVHIARVQQVSAFFGHQQGEEQRKTQN